MPLRRAVVLIAAIPVVLAPGFSLAGPARWNPRAWADESTVQLRTTATGEAEHWFKVWLVVLDDQLYVRLGSRAAGRLEKNTTGPVIGVRIAGQEFDRVRAVPAPESAERVNQAIANKYWSDVFVRWMSHPMTARLVPEPDAAK
jgi:hypothetical protein